MIDLDDRAKAVLQDLVSGMRDTTIMERHSLSHDELHRLFRQMFDAGVLLKPERAGVQPRRIETSAKKSPLPSPKTDPDDMREFERYYIDYDLQIYEPEQPEIIGTVRNITEKGVGLSGLEARVNEIKTLVVLGDTIGDIAPFEFEARCIWADTDEDSQETMAGFEITRISEEDQEELEKLVVF